MPHIKLTCAVRSHPKIFKVARDLGITKTEAIGYVVALWTWALSFAPDGDLVEFEPDDIEHAIGWHSDEGRLFAALDDAGVIETQETEAGLWRYFLADWSKLTAP